ncbi:MAG: tRNA pseudouridine(55) synthase TruB [Candidatus Pacearchaeota archaeon]|nr:MAG: tRNA pseudouridine(55) synthase TruB [Candidatus Pacearchaeota archaeon]
MDINKIKQKKSLKELLEFGIINIDKPSGPTSFQVSEYIKKELNLKKTSHFGTLDPAVTGVLPIALNRACRLTDFFIKKDKTYVGIMHLHKELSLEEVKNKIKEKFLGTIIQKPPVRSNVKREEREREIKKFEILEINGKEFLFLVECEAGTYIRKLIHDLGTELKVGAHMLELRRTKASIFSEDESYTLYDFERAVKEYKNGNEMFLRNMLIPGEIISKLYPIVRIKKEFIKRIIHGSPIYKNFLIKDERLKLNDIFCVFDDEKFIGVFRVVLDKKIFAKPEFVFQRINDT